jgi:hypothetical protein
VIGGNAESRHGDSGVPVSPRSHHWLGEQSGQAGEVIGRHGEGELPADLGQSAMTHLAQPSDCLGPAESFLHAFANALGDGIAGVADRAAVDRRTAAVGVLRDMRGDRASGWLQGKPRKPYRQETGVGTRAGNPEMKV